MSALTGTAALVRLMLRRDRVVLPTCIVVAAGFALLTATSFQGLYPTVAERSDFAATVAANSTFAVLYGPARALDTIGGLTAWRIGATVATVVALMSLLLVGRHTRAEEERGRAELLRAGAVGRFAPLAAALAVVAAVAVGLGMGLAHAIGSGDAAQVPHLVGAALAQLPAVWVLGAVVVALFGIVPRATTAAWVALGACVLLWLLGPLLDAPACLMDVSPFEHVPALPAASLAAGPPLALTAIAIALSAAGLNAFSRRDVG
jgi:ABC-2 type transport system permease protein